MAGELQELLGQKLVAFAVGDRHPRTIGRYARGERLPESQALGRLVDIYTVVRILGEGMRESSIKSWMMGRCPFPAPIVVRVVVCLGWFEGRRTGFADG